MMAKCDNTKSLDGKRQKREIIGQKESDIKKSSDECLSLAHIDRQLKGRERKEKLLFCLFFANFHKLLH